MSNNVDNLSVFDSLDYYWDDNQSISLPSKGSSPLLFSTDSIDTQMATNVSALSNSSSSSDNAIDSILILHDNLASAKPLKNPLPLKEGDSSLGKKKRKASSLDTSLSSHSDRRASQKKVKANPAQVKNHPFKTFQKFVQNFIIEDNTINAENLINYLYKGEILSPEQTNKKIKNIKKTMPLYISKINELANRAINKEIITTEYNNLRPFDFQKISLSPEEKEKLKNKTEELSHRYIRLNPNQIDSILNIFNYLEHEKNVMTREEIINFLEFVQPPSQFGTAMDIIRKTLIKANKHFKISSGFKYNKKNYYLFIPDNNQLFNRESFFRKIEEILNTKKNKLIARKGDEQSSLNNDSNIQQHEENLSLFSPLPSFQIDTDAQMATSVLSSSSSDQGQLTDTTSQSN